MASSFAWVSTPAHAHYLPNGACVVTKYDTPVLWCPSYRCRGVWVDWGRAFRVQWKSDGGVWVWNREMLGWIDRHAVRRDDERLCKAAGI